MADVKRAKSSNYFSLADCFEEMDLIQRFKHIYGGRRCLNSWMLMKFYDRSRTDIVCWRRPLSAVSSKRSLTLVSERNAVVNGSMSRISRKSVVQNLDNDLRPDHFKDSLSVNTCFSTKNEVNNEIQPQPDETCSSKVFSNETIRVQITTPENQNSVTDKFAETTGKVGQDSIPRARSLESALNQSLRYRQERNKFERRQILEKYKRQACLLNNKGTRNFRNCYGLSGPHLNRTLSIKKSTLSQNCNSREVGPCLDKRTRAKIHQKKLVIEGLSLTKDAIDKLINRNVCENFRIAPLFESLVTHLHPWKGYLHAEGILKCQQWLTEMQNVQEKTRSKGRVKCRSNPC